MQITTTLGSTELCSEVLYYITDSSDLFVQRLNKHILK